MINEPFRDFFKIILWSVWILMAIVFSLFFVVQALCNPNGSYIFVFIVFILFVAGILLSKLIWLLYGREVLEIEGDCLYLKYESPMISKTVIIPIAEVVDFAQSEKFLFDFGVYGYKYYQYGDFSLSLTNGTRINFGQGRSKDEFWYFKGIFLKEIGRE